MDEEPCLICPPLVINCLHDGERYLIAHADNGHLFVCYGWEEDLKFSGAPLRHELKNSLNRPCDNEALTVVWEEYEQRFLDGTLEMPARRYR